MSTSASGSSSRRRSPGRHQRTALGLLLAVGLVAASCGGDGTASADRVDQDAADQTAEDAERRVAAGDEAGADQSGAGEPAGSDQEARSVAADGSSPDEQADSDPDPDVDLDLDLDPTFAVEPAVWSGCGGGYQCATVAVPVDHATTDGPTIDLALVRVPAADADGEGVRGSIFVNPGGPGGSGVGYVRSGARLDAATMDDHHLVGFDPRGIGGSGPLSCAEPVDGPLPDFDPDDAVERAELDAWAVGLADRCEATDGDLLPHLTTDDVVADLDLLRQAVGDEQLRYLGFSYGTLIGLRYAERFPERVGRMILDGVVDPATTLTGLLAQQADGFDRVIDAVDDACGIAIRCPDGGVIAAYDRLQARLDTDGPIDGVGPTELAIATLISLYDEALWPRIADALDAAERGDVGGIVALERIYRGAADPAAYNAVVCADTPVPAGSEAWDRVEAELEGRSPRFGAVLANEVRACAHWPVRSTETPEPVDPEGIAPVLVLSTTGDPATPLENAVTVAGTLDGAGLVTVDDTSHIAYGRNGCVERIVADYLATGRVPPTVHRC
ncbi:MAG: alpha/beta hydrolase [Actinomycetota bacterium]